MSQFSGTLLQHGAVMEGLSEEAAMTYTGYAGGEDLQWPLLVEIPSGLPGFENANRFLLTPLADGLEPFMRLACEDDQTASFVLVPPGVFFEDYTIEIYDEYVEALELEGPGDVVVMVMVTLAQPPAECTVNLLGPIVINRRNMRASQVVQYKSDYRVAVPISAVTAHWKG
ncbi:MAG: flagellar assembly protein FliW [Actinobacteria bacterium]|nr:flagellar assembly protein FliW [Actinomycetota bacterium]